VVAFWAVFHLGDGRLRGGVIWSSSHYWAEKGLEDNYFLLLLGRFEMFSAFFGRYIWRFGAGRTIVARVRNE